jgi:hypothetical protein
MTGDESGNNPSKCLEVMHKTKKPVRITLWADKNMKQEY